MPVSKLKWHFFFVAFSCCLKVTLSYHLCVKYFSQFSFDSEMYTKSAAVLKQKVDCTLVILAIKLVSKILAGILYYFKLKYYNLMWTFPGCRSFADPTQRHINQYRKYHNLELTCENVWLTFQAHLGQSISEVSYNVLQPKLDD